MIFMSTPISYSSNKKSKVTQIKYKKSSVKKVSKCGKLRGKLARLLITHIYRTFYFITKEFKYFL